MMQEKVIKSPEQYSVKYNPYIVNIEALIQDVLAKHIYGVYGAIKEHIDNAIDAESSEIRFAFDPVTRVIQVMNKSEKGYTQQDVYELFYRKHHFQISQNNYGRIIILGFSKPSAFQITTYDKELKEYVKYELTCRGVSDRVIVKNDSSFKYTTMITARLDDNIEFNEEKFKEFIICIYNLHLYFKKVKIVVNGETLKHILPVGMPEITDFTFSRGRKFRMYMWKSPVWEKTIYKSESGITNLGVFITSKLTLVTYTPFYRSPANQYFCLVNDVEGYLADKYLDLGKLELCKEGAVGILMKELREKYLPKETIPQAFDSIIEELNSFAKDFFSYGVGSFAPSTDTPKVKGKVHNDNGQSKHDDNDVHKRNYNLPIISVSPFSDYEKIPVIDFRSAKELHLNTSDPLYTKVIANKKFLEVFLVRLIPYMDSRRKIDREELRISESHWLIEDQYMRKVTHCDGGK
jgi:hypothetical protein